MGCDVQDVQPFEALISGVNDADSRLTRIPESWLQGRSAFGGLSVAFGLRHCLDQESAPPRTVTARLWSVIPPGVLRSKAVALRRGRSVRIWRSRLEVDGQSVGEVDVIFGLPRESKIMIGGPPVPAGVRSAGRMLDASQKHVPAFLQHIDLCWLEGQPPFSGSQSRIIGGFCRHRTLSKGYGGIVALLDSWPAPVLSMSAAPIAASTVQLTAHFTREQPFDSGWFRYRAEAITSKDGYASTRADLWSADGHHVGWMEQLVAIYG
jgi:acyl-CoA thioesterase